MASESASLRKRRSTGATETEGASKGPSRTVQKNKFKTRNPQIPLTFFKEQRYWARFVIILAVVVIIYVSSLNMKEKKFARQREVLPYRFQPLRCQAKEEVVPGCTPKNCGRYVSDNLITENELENLLSFAKSGFKHLEGSSTEQELSATFDLSTKELSAGETILDLSKDSTVFTHEHLLALKLAKGRVLQSLQERFDITRRNVHLTSPLFFSKLTNGSQLEILSSHTITKDVHPVVFYKTVIYLRDHGTDFKGGRLMFIEDPPTNRTLSSVEARAGRILGFTSGRENLHYVEPITAGTQYQLTLHFTCDESAAIPEPWTGAVEEL